MTRIELLHAAVKEFNGRAFAAACLFFNDSKDENFEKGLVVKNYILYQEALSVTLVLKRIYQACLDIQRGLDIQENYWVIASLIQGESRRLEQASIKIASLSDLLLKEIESIPAKVYEYRTGAEYYREEEETDLFVSVRSFASQKEQQAYLSNELLEGIETVTNLQNYSTDMNRILSIALASGPVKKILELL